jgi:glycosyltransferase involved in cell wall biosynthesis
VNKNDARPRPKRILIVSDVSPLQTSGGSARVIREQGRGLAERGHEVSFLCRHPGGDTPLKGAIERIPVHQYAVARKSTLAYALTSFFGAKSLYQGQFGREAWDAVLLHQPFSSLGVQAARPTSEALIYFFHSPAGVEYRLRAVHPETKTTSAGTPFVAAILKQLERWACKSSHRIVVLSEFSRKIFRRTHDLVKPSIVVNPAGVDLEHFHPPEDRAAVRAHIDVPRGEPVLLTVRDLEQRMGIDTLLAAFKFLEKTPSFFCIIGGSGPLRPFLEKRASFLGLTERVRFTGHIPEQELPLYYQAADLFVLPTQAYEGFGLVTVESLACGTPVAATPVGATPEILEPLDQRFLATDNRAESLAHTLDCAIPLAMEPSMRSRCRSYVEGRYSWRDHVERIESELITIRGDVAND